ncbi:hypothetical protein Pfo_003456 [Paulownia fortunei]|nr:hypothetical protein Pfo_003456 [Paulownia fortunei]
MGFYEIYKCGYFDIDRHLITTLVERWCSETHAFHFRVGEVTVTLQDVAVIWGLPIKGKSITDTDIKRSKSQDYLIAHPVTNDTPDVDVERYARGCVLILLGSVIYPDTSCNKVSLLYLHHMEHIADCGRFSWGSAVLSFLYCELCNISARGKKDVSGATHLLQCHSYTHTMRHSIVRDILDRMTDKEMDIYHGMIALHAILYLLCTCLCIRDINIWIQLHWLLWYVFVHISSATFIFIV